MSLPYVGEIRMFAGNFAPVGWAFCQGQLLAIAGYSTLFNLIGTTYGGDGVTTFGLPNLSSRVPVHQGPGFTLGQAGGAETVTLAVSQLPAHAHVPQANSGTGTQTNPAHQVWAASSNFPYSTNPPNVDMTAAGVSSDGGSQPHDNMLPFLTINFIISFFGVFPSQN